MSTITMHLSSRNFRYYENSIKESFKQNLKGLSVIEMCITELCTRKCGFCPRADSKVYKNQKLFMSMDTLCEIGKECKENNFEGDFHFSGFGESLTNPQFFNLIKKLREYLPNNHIALTSNGDLLNHEVCENIYDSGVNHIIISCYDGPESYDKFDQMLFKLNKSYDIRKLWIAPDKTMEDLARENKFNNRSGAVSTINFDENKELYKNNPCYLPFYKLVLDYNGDALLCCNDWFRNHKGFGNIHTNSLKEIWMSNEFVKVRNNLKQGIRSGPACSNCSIQGDLIGEESVVVLHE